ncbi:MAG: hypothetical protein EP346_13720 [Bacteroidetes bacterium]|nr:MAG: hypothetical protein EP346_13720 [Bacteroidota bacterium]
MSDGISILENQINRIMANSFSCMYVHIVWATKRRQWQIAPQLKDEVEELLVSIVQEYGVVPIASFAPSLRASIIHPG